LTVALNVQPGESLLIRGGTSSIGLAAAVLAKDRGLTVLATTRSEERFDVLRGAGVDHPIVDGGEIAEAVWKIVPGGVDKALELVGTDAMRDTLLATRVRGTVCFTGMLSNVWTVPDFYPMDYIPNGVRLTAYSGDAADLPPEVLQSFLDDLASGRLTLPLHRAYAFEEIVEAHRAMEANDATGKLVVTV